MTGTESGVQQAVGVQVTGLPAQQSTPYAECRAGMTNCNGYCRDLTADISNCGSCGNACPAGMACSNAQCSVRCTGGKSACSGACVDLKSDAANCGSCGNLCPAGQSCTNGLCAIPCPQMLVNCNGVCRELRSDAANCGACGNVCPAGQYCSNGQCVGSASGQGTGITSGQGTGTTSGCSGNGEKLCNGMCVNSFSDINNCGACSVTCHCPPITDPTVTCIPSCAFGHCYVSCAKVIGPGTGSAMLKTYDALMTDPDHCGTCFNKCASGQSCVGGQCAGSPSYATCASGTMLCNGMCVNVQVDEQNCGSCGNRCMGSTSTCCGGTCVNLMTSQNNCGSCGKICKPECHCEGGCISNDFKPKPPGYTCDAN